MSMGVLALILFAVFFAFLIVGVPIGFALGLAGIIGLIFMDQPFMMFSQTLITGIDNFALLSIPFFVLLGVVMERAEISRSLVDLADELVGFIRGGMAIVTVLASMFFATVSGSGPATVAAIGSITIPDMTKRGYSRRFAVGVASSAGALGPIIPPSIPFIIYGVTTGESIAKLFLGGMGAGILLGLLLMILSYWKARREGVPVSGKRPSLKSAAKATWRAKEALIAPIVVLGGIYAGLYTPTEAGAIGSIYVIGVGFFKRTLTIRSFCGCVEKSAKISAMIMFVLATAYLLAWVMSAGQIPQVAAALILEWANNKFLFFLFVNILFLFIGSVLDTPAAIVILAPILAPIAAKLGIDPIHFGTVVVVNFVVGYITPPFAINLFVAKGLTGMTMEECSVAIWPFIMVSVFGLILITVFPSVSLFFPKLFMG
jgi:tripartite ATP-independent transporter DctM subunit